MTGCSVVNIYDMLKMFGEKTVVEILSGFSCPLNKSVENFFRNNAINFARQKISVTYLVIRNLGMEKQQLLGAFALTHKAVSVNKANVSNTFIRKLKRYASAGESGEYNVSAFMLAQFGKNFNFERGQLIRGDELMNLAMSILCDVQCCIGGGVVYLDCEDNEKLLDFYRNDCNRFVVFGDRMSKTDDKKYLKLMKFF